jgi:hypothetical protein
MERVLAPRSGICFSLKKGQRLKVMDPYGEQVSDLYCFNSEDLKESLSSGRSIDYNDTIFLTTGHTLYSNRCSAMLRIVEDSCGRHDFMLTPCSSEDCHPSCHENLAIHFAPHGIHDDDISTTFNIFMNVEVEPNGSIRIEKPKSLAGDQIVFEACMDLLVGLTACSHEQTNNGHCKPIHFEILTGGFSESLTQGQATGLG